VRLQQGRRLFQRLDPAVFSSRFAKFIGSVAAPSGPKGWWQSTARHCGGRSTRRRADRSNEIPAIRALIAWRCQIFYVSGLCDSLSSLRSQGADPGGKRSPNWTANCLIAAVHSIFRCQHRPAFLMARYINPSSVRRFICISRVAAGDECIPQAANRPSAPLDRAPCTCVPPMPDNARDCR
jgi:hypothetical protein